MLSPCVHSLQPILRTWPMVKCAYVDLEHAHDKLMKLLAMWEDPLLDNPYGVLAGNLYAVFDHLAFASHQLRSPYQRKRGGRTFVTKDDLKRAEAIDRVVRELADRMHEIWQSRRPRGPALAKDLFGVEHQLATLIGKVVKPKFESRTKAANDSLESELPWQKILDRMGLKATPAGYVGSLHETAAA